MNYKNCQSCGMPFSRDPQGGGTEADGSKSVMYCSKCYQQGKFTLPNITLEEMTELVRGKMRQMHIPGFLIPVFTRKIPKLHRWSNVR